MALKTVAQYKDSVAAMLSGVDLNNVDNLNGAIERAARILVQQADVPEASLTQNIMLYDGVTDYACDTRIFGTAINDIRPQGQTRNINDTVAKRFGEDFDRTKNYLSNGTMATFEYENGVPIIRIVSTVPQQRIVIDNMTATTGWTAAGSASNLALDTAVYYQQPGSLRFTLTGSSTGTLTKTLSSPLDCESYEDLGVAFLAVYIPNGATASDLTSIALKLGSDSSNYDSVSSTSGFIGAWTAGEWLLVAFDFSGATSTGTPDWTAIDYVQLSFAHSATFTNFRIGGLWIALPSPNQILCQSAAIFKASGSDASENITTDDDTILLNNPAYTLFEYEGALSILQQTGATESNAMMQSFKQTLHGNGSTDMGLYALFRGNNPSQELRQTGSWYDGENNGYNNYNNY